MEGDLVTGHDNSVNLLHIPILSLASRSLWAKTDQAYKTDKTHPLICHIIDTANVAAIAWDRIFSRSNREAVAMGMGLDIAAARSWAIFLAAIHDLGKASLGFQLGVLRGHTGASRDDEHRLVADMLRAGGLAVPVGLPTLTNHADLSFTALRDGLEQMGLDRRVGAGLAEIVGGHHGRFMTATQCANTMLDDQGDSTWIAARTELITLATALSGVRDAPAPGHRPSRAAAVLLAGLATVSDWIASNTDLFAYETAMGGAFTDDPGDYAARSRDNANLALSRMSWAGDRPAGDGQPSFLDLFRREPRPFQAVLEALLPDIPQPALVVIEAPTGEGKTEAALLAADRWGTQRDHRGMYFALPTRATSEGIAGRMLPYLERRYSGETIAAQLVHGRSLINKSLDVFRRRADRDWVSPTAVGDADGDGGISVGRWFGARRRGLLAPFGVGTVDQALLAAIGVKHSYVLMTGLASKTVVFDEVHAYDAVMNVRFEVLLAWLGAMGASAVVLSATLPDRMRRRFVAAYAQGAGHRLRPADLPAIAYPRITIFSARGADGRHVDPANRYRPDVAIHWISPDHALAVAEERLDAGECVAVMCHSVRQAQEAYQELKSRHPGLDEHGEPVVDIFHARFIEDDKETRRQRVLRRFGPGPEATDGQPTGSPSRPHGAILVATSIIEQSLDLDFDALITPLAPVDLLIQRLGRVWRHGFNARPAGNTGPAVWISRALDGDGIPVFPWWETRMYSAHRLFRTWWALRDRSGFNDATEVETLVEAVYADDGETAAVALRNGLRPVEGAAWGRSMVEEAHDADALRSSANRGSIPMPWEAAPLYKITNALGDDDGDDAEVEGESDVDLGTRAGSSSVTLICLYGLQGAPTLDAAGLIPAWIAKTPTDRPSADDLRALLARSVSVIHPPRTDLASLPGWSENAILRPCRPVFFAPDGDARLDDQSIHLDAEIGLSMRSGSAAPGRLQKELAA